MDSAEIAEAGGVANVTATLSAVSGTDVTVDFTLTGTATPTDDYTSSGNQIVIAAGATSGSIALTAVDDDADEEDETVISDIAVSGGATEDGEQQVTVTILDDDAGSEPPVLTNPGTQSMSTTQDTSSVTLEATDPNSASSKGSPIIFL